MNCLNFVRVGEVKVPKGSETFFSNNFLLNKCLYGPRSNPLPFLHTIFHEKGTLFVYLRLTNGIYSFQIPCLELCIPFNFCKCTVF